MRYNGDMNFINKNWGRVALVVFSVLLPVVSFADQKESTCSPTGGKICNPIPNITSIPGLIQTVLEGVIRIGLPVVALAIIYCGFLFVFARGNSEKLTKARESLMYTLIGSAILLGSWAIALMIEATVTGLAS